LVDYFSHLADTAGRWAKLTPGAQAAFGGLSRFSSTGPVLPAQFRERERGHGQRDGSVNVPIDVTYTTGTGATTAATVSTNNCGWCRRTACCSSTRWPK